MALQETVRMDVRVVKMLKNGRQPSQTRRDSQWRRGGRRTVKSGRNRFPDRSDGDE